jgi:hypothetical protein
MAEIHAHKPSAAAIDIAASRRIAEPDELAGQATQFELFERSRLDADGA